MDFIAITGGRARSGHFQFTCDTDNIDDILREAGRKLDFGEDVIAIGKVEWVDLPGTMRKLA